MRRLVWREGDDVAGAIGRSCRAALANDDWAWEGCEDWWVVEHIDRLARLGYREPVGPRCELVPLRELAELWTEDGMRRE